MEKIKLLYVENIISRKRSAVVQRLSFFVRVENAHYDKKIDVLWAGEDGEWHVLAAQYHSWAGDGMEYWHANVDSSLTSARSLPGNVQFAVRYQAYAEEYWDNNQEKNYSSEADSGVKLAHNSLIQNVAFAENLTELGSTIPVTIAVDKSFNANKVTIHWTTNNWKTTNKSACHFKRKHWDTRCSSNARNPNQYAVEMWSGALKQVDAFQFQYSVCCENDQQTIWENNSGSNYCFKREPLKVLILNLHCYQEENQDEKFSLIANTIDELDIDIVCLQEVAEYWRDGEGDWESNAAKIINDRLTKAYHLHTDWSHLGFDQYREGVAILSRYPLSAHQARYVSQSDDVYDIHSRKVVMARVQVPFIGEINVFSAHLSWFDDGFKQQFHCLHKWAEEMHTDATKATMLCGDFNIAAGSKGYEFVVDSKKYDDQYLAANQHGLFDKIFRVNDQHWDEHWQDLLADDYRIDYVFMDKASVLQVTSARTIFTEQDYGRVSDHCGYLMTFEPINENS